MDNNILCENILNELEQQITWRIVELEQIENVLYDKKENEDFCEIYRKTLIIMVYAHFEGYCKSALSIYADYINRLHLPVKDVTDGLASSSLGRAFQRLFDSDYKPVDLGERCIKDDSMLHAFGRRKEFISNYIPHTSSIVEIPDNIIDTESNLKSHVLKKILYRLDIDYKFVDDYQKEINELVNKRNSFAHGDRLKGPSEKEYEEFKSKAQSLMLKIKDITYEHFSNHKFLRATAV